MILPEPEKIIALLVELVKRGERKPQQLARRLARKGIAMGCTEIQHIFDYYEIGKKTL